MQATETEPSGIEANPVALNAIMRASEKHLIVACEDIVDARGFKLWAKGQPVSASLQQKLLERRLERPLEPAHRPGRRHTALPSGKHGQLFIQPIGPGAGPCAGRARCKSTCKA